MSSARARFIAFLLLLSMFGTLPPRVSRAMLLNVRQDGTGDFDTLTDAIAAASSNDSIAIGPGTYAEGATFTLDLALTLFSTDGPEVTIIDGESSYRIFETHVAGIRLQGLQFAHGRGPGASPTAGGAALMWSGSQVELIDCAFRDHVADWGGAIYVTDSNLGNQTTLSARNCVFESNVAFQTAAVAYVVNGAVGNFTECTIGQNQAGIKGGAFHIIRSTGNFEGCSFSGNRSGDIAGAIFFEDSAGFVRESSFYDHTSPGLIAGTVVIQLSRGTQIIRNIFSGDTAGFGLRYYETVDAHSCNVFWNNADGAVGGAPLAPDEVVADPLFCDPLAHDFTLSDTSPAAPAHSACGQLIGAFPVACSLPPGPTAAPRIASIEDVPDDNGKQVRIRWERSLYDSHGAAYSILGYGIYRRAPELGGSVVETSAGGVRRPGVDLDGWDFIATVPARGDGIYQYVAPTLCDSHHNQTCWSVFFVSAMTGDPLTFFDSEPDSGFSTDDLPPAVPSNLVGTHTASGTALQWDRNPDTVMEYHVYRGSGDFALNPSAMVGNTSENSWLDEGISALPSAYKVTAVDEAGNESAAALWDGATTDSGTSPPARYALHGNEPNPFNPVTTIYFDVPGEGGNISLRIFDVRGNLIRTLIHGFEGAGVRRGVTWNGLNDGGRRVPSGVYFCRMQAPGFDDSIRLTLIE